MKPQPFAALLIAAILTGVGALPGSGCASQSATRFQPATTNSLAAFSDTDLRLTRLVVDGAQIDASAYPITLRFEENGKVSGRSAVNRYFGAYQLGDQGAVTWPPPGLGMTRMAGPAPAMELEGRFAKAITVTTQLLTSPAAVRFQSTDGSQAIEFQR